MFSEDLYFFNFVEKNLSKTLRAFLLKQKLGNGYMFPKSILHVYMLFKLLYMFGRKFL